MQGAARPMFPFEDAWEHVAHDEYGASLDYTDFDPTEATGELVFELLTCKFRVDLVPSCLFGFCCQLLRQQPGVQARMSLRHYCNKSFQCLLAAGFKALESELQAEAEAEDAAALPDIPTKARLLHEIARRGCCH